MDDRMTMQEFAEQYGITSRAKYIGRQYEGQWKGSDKWEVTLKGPHGSMKLPFYMGSGHKGTPPDTAGVLSCLASDVSSVIDTSSAQEWGEEIGYSWDVPTTRLNVMRMWRQIRGQEAKLEAILGEAAYNTLLQDVGPE